MNLEIGNLVAKQEAEQKLRDRQIQTETEHGEMNFREPLKMKERKQKPSKNEELPKHKLIKGSSTASGSVANEIKKMLDQEEQQ